ncbi:TonB-dependent receptor domain-containing protein [Halomonas huangheensis]|uniref:TonB-denpendent receptor n=1 Tax=Halomonas huangheensis TaxID=1178482 RepID=W1N790_9GAMM|nr:TonB-dependent receptor [Halomonas huangheensis]ALM53070.1 TonB-dependent receptor [Halomonas huangheensis]ERL51369.1 hypothetical protein BJB45_14350 [Halomonas huangheensis]
MLRSFTPGRVGILPGLFAAPWLLVAEASAQTSDNNDATITLDPVVVSATLTPRTASQSLASVSVIDKETLRRRDPVSLTDALRGQPGVDMSTNGAFGKNASLYLRGTGSQSALLMIDGIRLRSATNGGPGWQFLDPQMFERIEVVRGPRGALYGADAVGGVVQLFTRDDGGGEPRPSISIGGGSPDGVRGFASLAGESKGTHYQFSASHLNTGGAPVREGGEDKGYDNTSGLVRVAQDLAGGGQLGVIGLRASGNTEYEGGDSDYVQQVAGAFAELPVTGNWTSRVTLSQAQDQLDDYADYGYSRFDTTTHTARWDNTFNIGRHELVAGAEYLEDKVDSSTNFDNDSRDNVAVFTQALLDFEPFSVQAGLRYDDNESYGEEVTGQLALGYQLDSHHTLRGSYGTAFRAPTFNELYYPDYGNPDLNAEDSESWELGVRGQFRNAFWDLALYQTDIEDMIANTRRDGISAPYNVNSARIRGIELSAGIDIDQWSLAAAATYTDPEDRDTGNQLARRATQTLRLDADRQLGDWNLGTSFVAQNHRYNDEANDQRLAGYGSLDLRAGWRFAPGWKARLSVENVFDREYATSSSFEGWDYINPGRTAWLTVGFGE